MRISLTAPEDSTVVIGLAMRHLRCCEDAAEIDFFSRQRCGFGALRDFFQFGIDAGTHVGKLFFTQLSIVNQSILEPLDRTFLLPGFDLFLRAITGAGIASEMAIPAVGETFQKSRAAAAATLRRGFLSLLVNSLNVVAIDGFALEAIRRPAFTQV